MKKSFFEKVKEKFGDKFILSKVDYKNCNEKVCIICPKHGKFWQTPINHLINFEGCPKCTQSKGESFIENILINQKINFVRQFPVIINENNYKIDFMWKYKNKVVFIEYNGIQHYFPVELFGGVNAFNKQIARDNAVRNYCKENNIILLEYCYNIPFNKLVTILNNDLKEIINDD